MDVLINNAAQRFESFQQSADGIEMTFATNHLSHFLLTALLLESLEKAPDPRIINVVGERHRGALSDFEQCLTPMSFDRQAALSASKLANVVFTVELAARLRSIGITVNAANPGVVASRAGCNGQVVPWLRHVVSHLLRGGLSTPRIGADTIIFLATAPEVRGVSGGYFYRREERALA